MHNKDDVLVPAHHPFREVWADKFKPFTSLDEYRIIQNRLERGGSLDELINQKVLKAYFPGARHADVKKLHDHWACPTSAASLFEHCPIEFPCLEGWAERQRATRWTSHDTSQIRN